MLRSLGSSMGISVIQATLTTNAAMAHARLGEGLYPGAAAVSAAARVMGSPTTVRGAASLNGLLTQQATMVGYVDVFSWMAILTLLLFPLLFVMRPPSPAQPLALEAAAE